MLFRRLSGSWPSVSTPRSHAFGLLLVAWDGTSLDLADSPANAEAFGRPSNKKRESGYPQSRVVILMTCGSRRIIDAVFGTYRSNERALAERLLPTLKAGMLLLADRRYAAYRLWRAAQATPAVVTGASAGLGTAYAQRLADRGYHLILVARNTARLETLASDIRSRTGRAVDVVTADLTDAAQIAVVEERLRTDESIEVLINNAGGALLTPLTGSDAAAYEALINLNVTSLTRLTIAVLPGLTARGRGTVVNISSAMALNIMPVSAVYSGTKSYVLTFTQALQQELAESPVTVQAVLPGAVRTDLWDGSGVDLATFPDEIVMNVDDAVDAALAGLDAGEPVTILSLPDISDWESFEKARQTLVPNLSLRIPADRYRG
ncbi:SDR family NAD(P)-dependent oxidoreductase [Streptomyces sp. 061-3]|uniref:SDR family NAD(P)-dependent oxidoreductase n=1 Tax=Streptomyces sp. 061-3 TaxID=2789268 RepID=UPI003980BD57